MKKTLKRVLFFPLTLALLLCATGCRFRTLDSWHTEIAKQEYEPAQINEFREDYQLGTCQNLRGDVSVILFYMDDFESKWTEQEVEEFTENEIAPGLDFLERQASKYGIDLQFHIAEVYQSLYYDDEVIVNTKAEGYATVDVLKQAASGSGFHDTEVMIQYFRSVYQTDEVVCYTLFNKNGTAYAINPKRGANITVDEHCIVFARDLNSSGNDPVGSQASIVAHEMLHLFGAEDLYATPSRKSLAQWYCTNDIMLGANYDIETNTLTDVTAFYIGWHDVIPAVLHRSDWN